MVDYNKIYEALAAHKYRVITPAGLAHKIGVERIYGATMLKLCRDGYLQQAPAKGIYYIVGK